MFRSHHIPFLQNLTHTIPAAEIYTGDPCRSANQRPDRWDCPAAPAVPSGHYGSEIHLLRLYYAPRQRPSDESTDSLFIGHGSPKPCKVPVEPRSAGADSGEHERRVKRHTCKASDSYGASG